MESEFADLLLLNKCDLVTDAQRASVEGFLRKVNPTADIVCTEHSKLEPAALLDKARFNMDKAEQHPQWLTEAREHEHTPETEEYASQHLPRAPAPPAHARTSRARHPSSDPVPRAEVTPSLLTMAGTALPASSFAPSAPSTRSACTRPSRVGTATPRGSTKCSFRMAQPKRTWRGSPHLAGC